MRRLAKWVALTWWRFRETRNQAWQDGYNLADSEWEDSFRDKEAWAERCEAAIHGLFQILTNEQWEAMDPELREFLRNWA